MLRLAWQELKFRRNGIIGWSLGLCLLPLIYISVYPSVIDQMAGLADLELYKALGMSISTFAGWVGSILMVFLPLIASIYAIINGTGTLAGEEEDGRLEMLVTLPLPRWQIVIAKAIAFSLATLIMLLVVAGVSWIVFQMIANQIETDLTGLDLASAVLSTWPLIFAMGMISLFLAAFSASRRVAALIGAAILIISYFGNNLAASTSVLKPFEPLFLFTYLDASGQAVRDGQSFGNIAILLGIGLVALLLALFFFQRRNLTVGMWPWQRARVPS